MKFPKTIYYSDEVNDEFSGFKVRDYKLSENYVYIHNNAIYKFFAFIVYRIIMIPYAFFYLKLKYRFKIHNRKILKKFKNSGYFLYGNHTNIPADAYIPNMISSPKRNYVIVNSQNFAIRGTRTFLAMCGGIPIADSFKGFKNFIEAIEKRSVNKNSITIYPEAHVWPFYTKIRPFKSTSFKYPIQFNEPSFSFTITYQKRKYSKKPRIVVYLDGPFYANYDLSPKERKEDLRNRIYNKMVERSKNNNIELIKYIKKESNL